MGFRFWSRMPGAPFAPEGLKKPHLRIFLNQRTPGAPSFALFAKGGAPRISIPTPAYPTLCKGRKGDGPPVRLSSAVALMASR
jgi:hypothetical protein